ncbi:MAG: family 65 glycosyl hydrolase [Oscillospiraceae bacterium]|jgi:maltose phosphorylase|nr:family 65 glycosyl hydrolase [Oscillospiraceae bacterium]
MAKIADRYFHTDPWKVIERGFNPAYARVSESVFALSNEALGVRGCFDEGGSVDSLRGAYVNGVYELEELPKSYRGIVDKTHFMIPAADWLDTRVSVDGETLDLGKVRFSGFSRELDMRAGTLTRRFVWHTESGKDLCLTFLRFVDMNHGERAYQRITFEALNFSGSVEFASGITFDVKHEGRNACFWEATRAELPADRGFICAIQARTRSSGQEVFTAAVVTGAGEGRANRGKKAVARDTTLELTKGTPLHIDKRAVILFNGTDGESLWESGQTALRETAAVSLDEALEAQKAYWGEHWRVSDVIIEPSGETGAADGEQQGVRFCSFQMAQTYNGGSVRHNIGAKGLTGEAYNGHAFWDTETCCLPFYLFTNPAAAKSLLIFRYNTLPQAIERAKALDCEGACYPVATLNGDEACNLWQHASLQFQPSTAVAYGIRNYTQVTGDTGFLWEYGAEMLLQIARFLKSRAAQNPHTGEYGYYGVMGPDEFHMMVHNNAYTNYMGKRSLEYAAETLLALQTEKPEIFARLREKTDLREGEIGLWREIAGRMALPVTEEGLFEQHDGYFNLPHIDIHAIPVAEFPLYDHWSYDRIYRTDMIKQPDVLMYLYLYGTSFSTAVKRVNYEFYEPRTIHESSLAPAIHSILAAELGKMEEAVSFFGYATRLDLDNYNRNTREGLHTTSIAMAWVNIVYGFAGLRSDGDLLRFAPRLPDRWSRLRFSLTYRDRVIKIEMTREGSRFALTEGEAVEALVYGRPAVIGKDGLFVPAE